MGKSDIFLILDMMSRQDGSFFLLSFFIGALSSQFSEIFHLDDIFMWLDCSILKLYGHDFSILFAPPDIIFSV